MSGCARLIDGKDWRRAGGNCTDHPTMRHPQPTNRGFTLAELAIAVVIVGILAAIALPNFTDYVRKSRRADAFDAMAHVQQEQERYRSNSATYASSFTELGVASLSQSGYYKLTLSESSSLGYTLSVAPADGSKQAQDKDCASFKLVVYKASSRRTALNGAGSDTSTACLPQ